MTGMASEKTFFEKVLDLTMLIPEGRVTSYGAIARYLGMARSARMVGWALNQSSFDRKFIPAHRVVNRLGMLTGAQHFGGSTVMSDLLTSEGIEVKNNQIVNFEQHFWDPSKELI